MPGDRGRRYVGWTGGGDNEEIKGREAGGFQQQDSRYFTPIALGYHGLRRTPERADGGEDGSIARKRLPGCDSAE